MALRADLMRCKIDRMAHSGGKTNANVCSTSDDESYVRREHAFGSAGEDRDCGFGDDGFPDGLCKCAGEVVDAAVSWRRCRSVWSCVRAFGLLGLPSVLPITAMIDDVE
jgi:hypothetical protein